jgi:hypothetical protein
LILSQPLSMGQVAAGGLVVVGIVMARLASNGNRSLKH